MDLPLRTQRPQWPFPKYQNSKGVVQNQSRSKSYSLSCNVWVWNKDNSNLIKNTPYYNSWQEYTTDNVILFLSINLSTSNKTVL